MASTTLQIFTIERRIEQLEAIRKNLASLINLSVNCDVLTLVDCQKEIVDRLSNARHEYTQLTEKFRSTC